MHQPLNLSDWNKTIITAQKHRLKKPPPPKKIVKLAILPYNNKHTVRINILSKWITTQLQENLTKEPWFSKRPIKIKKEETMVFLPGKTLCSQRDDPKTSMIAR